MPEGTSAADEPRVAIVTGAGRGIGRAVALELARAGYTLCIAARSREELEETRSQSGLAPRQALIVLVDLASEEAPEQLIVAALDCYGRVDVLVNNAGTAEPRVGAAELTADEAMKGFGINVFGPVRVMHAFLPLLRASDNPGS